MISPKNKEFDFYLDNIARNLSITDSMFNKAVSSYQAVGTWLDEGLQEYSVTILPQGSFNLGTVIKPTSDKDDYDIDLVCLVENKKKIASPKDLKQTIGKRLKENKIYCGKLSEEGKRCWTLEYDEFHMDILPAIPKSDKFDKENNADIKITHTDNRVDYFFKESNPFEYKKWFMEKANLIKPEEVMFSRSMEAVEKVPKYSKTTVLQECIKILKRHRDIMFEQNDDDAPISMIITTLSGLVYDGTQSISMALELILYKMDDFIERDSNGIYKIKNPVNNKENFADKWNKVPNKARCFYEWLKAAKNDLIIDNIKVHGTDEICRFLGGKLGENMVKKSFEDAADIRRRLREQNSLYVKKNLTSEFSIEKSDDNMNVKEHVFFGE